MGMGDLKKSLNTTFIYEKKKSHQTSGSIGHMSLILAGRLCRNNNLDTSN